MGRGVGGGVECACGEGVGGEGEYMCMMGGM